MKRAVNLRRYPQGAAVQGSVLKANHEKLVALPFRIVQAALPFLRRQGHADIVMITSNRTRLPLPGGMHMHNPGVAHGSAQSRLIALSCHLRNTRWEIAAVMKKIAMPVKEIRASAANSRGVLRR